MRHLLSVVSFLVLATTLACTPSSLVTQVTPDASHWFDAYLPDTSLPDSFVLTQLSPDGSATVVDPDTPCPADVAADAGADAEEAEAGEDAGVGDASLDADGCTAPLSRGDLVFDEVMIASVAGSSDSGQWLEVRSTLGCSVNLLGVAASAPHGSTFRTMNVTTDAWLPPGGFFLIADTLDPSENDDLPGLVFAWTGSPADALHKTSDTITLSFGTVTLDELTYPDKERADGTSMAFPASCAPTLASDFTSWVPSVASWTPGFHGTPGAPNTDVTCAVPALPTCARARSAPARR